MTYGMYSAIRSVIFIGLYLISTGLLIPKCIREWQLWKTTGKTGHLSGAAASAVTAFFFLAADFLAFMIAVAGWQQ